MCSGISQSLFGPKEVGPSGGFNVHSLASTLKAGLWGTWDRHERMLEGKMGNVKLFSLGGGEDII